MELGAFSVSLPVKNLAKSKDFYLALGFEIIGGDEGQNWLILRHGETTLGLFQGMFDRTMLTFNPGWDAQGQELDKFTDVRELERHFKERGLSISKNAEDGTGPASLILSDPDGNPILIDQHVDAPDS